MSRLSVGVDAESHPDGIFYFLHWPTSSNGRLFLNRPGPKYQLISLSLTSMVMELNATATSVNNPNKTPMPADVIATMIWSINITNAASKGMLVKVTNPPLFMFVGLICAVAPKQGVGLNVKNGSQRFDRFLWTAAARFQQLDGAQPRPLQSLGAVFSDK